MMFTSQGHSDFKESQKSPAGWGLRCENGGVFAGTRLPGDSSQQQHSPQFFITFHKNTQRGGLPEKVVRAKA